MGISPTGSSPPLVTNASGPLTERGSGDEEGATYTITEKCGRLFCDTLRAVFLGEGNTAQNGSLVMGTNNNNNHIHRNGAPSKRERERQSIGQSSGRQPVVDDWLEVWDYQGGASFRGFITINSDERDMFVFLDQSAVVQDLKPR